MRVSRSGVAVVGAVALATLGCGSAGEPDPLVVIEPIQVQSVTVLVGQPEAGRVSAHVQGLIGNGCTDLSSERQQRSGTLVAVTIERTRVLADACTEIAKLYDKVLVLDGRFDPGDYTLRVNDVERRFSMP